MGCCGSALHGRAAIRIIGHQLMKKYIYLVNLSSEHLYSQEGAWMCEDAY